MRNKLHQYQISLVFGCLSLIFCVVSVKALDPGKYPTQYIHDVWTTNEGLPQDTVTGIVQDKEGYVWFGTQEALVRFDGTAFTVFDPHNTEVFKGGVYAVFVDSAGVLWIGSSNGLMRYRNGAFQFFGESNGLLFDNSVKNISEDASGNLWLGFSTGDKKSGDTGGLGKFKDEQGHIFGVEDGLPNNLVKKTAADREGNLWIATADGLSRLKDGKFTNYRTADGLSDNFVRTVYTDREGSLWIGTADGLNRLKDGKFTVFTIKEGLSDNSITSLFEDRDGILWIGTDNGLNRMVDGKIQPFKGVEALEKDGINSLMEDSEGSLWVGTHASGLHRLRDGKFTVFGPPEGLLGESVNAIFEDQDGRIMIGTNPGGLNVLSDKGLTAYSPADGLSNDRIQMIAQDGGKIYWIGTRRGLDRFKDGQLTAYADKGKLLNPSIRSFYSDFDGAFWIGTSDNGIYELVEGKFIRFPNLDRFANKNISTIYRDRQQRIWLGMDGDTGYFKDGAFTPYARGELQKANVQSIYEDENGVLWFATWNQGLMRLKDEKLTVYKNQDGLFDETQWSILDDGAGNLWMGSNRGIFSVSKQELNDFAEGRIDKIHSTVYGTADGLRKRENNLGNPSAIRSRDGRLWFSTTGGAAVIDPKNIKINRLPPPVILERVSVDENDAAGDEQLIIPPGAKNVEFHYAGLSFIDPSKMRYKYKLEGFDTDWVDAGRRRAAFYTNLPAGHYEFRVIAANSDGVWNERGANFRFRVLAPYWRTWWFYSLVVLAIGGTAFLFYRWRIDKLKREKLAQQNFSRQLIESQEKERKRVAVELHDGLGQSLILIKNHALIGLNQPANHEKLLAQMVEISEAVSFTIAEVRGIARNLHPYQIEYLGLTTALESMIKNASDASNIEFVTDIDELAGRLSKEAEVNLYRIVQEALNNILKHSEARQASVSIKENARSLDLTIQDDGRGFAFDPENKNRGLGLVGMSERAKILSADYEISHSEYGTKIRLQMNLPAKKNEK